MQAPLRLNLCLKCADCQPRSLQQLWDELEPDYMGESHFTFKNLQLHLQALQAIGVFKLLETNTNNSSSHVEDAFYILTEYGRQKMRKALE